MGGGGVGSGTFVGTPDHLVLREGSHSARPGVDVVRRGLPMYAQDHYATPTDHQVRYSSLVYLVGRETDEGFESQASSGPSGVTGLPWSISDEGRLTKVL